MSFIACLLLASELGEHKRYPHTSFPETIPQGVYPLQLVKQSMVSFVELVVAGRMKHNVSQHRLTNRSFQKSATNTRRQHFIRAVVTETCTS